MHTLTLSYIIQRFKFNTKLKYKIIGLFLSSFILFFNCKGQKGFGTENQINCGSPDMMKALLQKDIFYFNLNKQIEEKLAVYNKNTLSHLRNQTVIYLPVVVHIIHNNGLENISDADVLRGIQHLNEAFANTGYYNPADGVNTLIQFCLAQRDPNGDATNGITRDVSPYTVMSGPSAYTDDIHVKNVNRWNPYCYINIWLVRDIPGDVAGYAYLPAAHGSNIDGIVAEAAFFGSSFANDVVIIHEMGHYLGLYHTFENGCSNNDCLTDGDRVCDTPPDQSTAATNCNVPVNSCSTDVLSGFSSDQNDLTQDYMDYGNWNCMSVFTQGQADRMNWHITNVRSSLLNCLSCSSPCPNPITASFNSSATTVTAGTAVNFTNTSTNGTTYEWYINNVLQTSNVNFSNTFNTPGQFSVKLIASGNNPSLCAPSADSVIITVTCPVNAGFNPSALEIPLGQSINFTNTTTGTGATYSWLINNILVSSATDLSYQFNQAGTFTIILNASTPFCTTSKSVTVDVKSPCNNNVYFEKVISHPSAQILPYSTIIAADSSIVIACDMLRFTPPFNGSWGTIFKLTKSGNLLWVKEYKGGLNTQFNKIIQTSDGNFVAIGSIIVGLLDRRILVVKIDPNGQLLWKKTYLKTGDVNVNQGLLNILTETPSNEILCGITTNGPVTRLHLLKLSSSSGNALWSKEILPASKCIFSDLAIKNNDLYATFTYSENSFNRAGLAKIDLTNGTVIFAKQYQMNETPLKNQLKFHSLSLINDEIRVYGSTTPGALSIDTGSHILANFDMVGNLKNINRIRLTDNNLLETFPLHRRFGIILRDGEFAFCEGMQSGSFNSRTFFHQNDLFNSNPSTVKLSTTVRATFGIVEGKDNNILTISTMLDPANPGLYKDLSIFSSPKTGIISANCATPSTYANYGVNITVTDFPLAFADAAFTTDAPFILYDSTVTYNSTVLCSANPVVPCYSVKINAPDTICISQDSILISCKRNPGCTETVNWNISPQNSFRKINDTTIKILFTSLGNTTIAASLSSCPSVNDTAHLFIGKNSSLFSLGPDKTLCNFSTAVLKAGPGYKSYKWYDGSRDSTNTINSVGTYFVTVEDFCNNVHTDTINYILASAPVFDIGADTIICSADTLTITAPPGYLSYTWASNYKISSTTGRVVKVWPQTDTIYTATALLNTGCTVLDSIKVSLKKTTPLYLGNDTSFCQGGSVYLNAGAGFIAYQWSTGATTPAITVSTAGSFLIAATGSNGCISRDTFRVIRLLAKPVVNLGGDTAICIDKTIVLTPGNVTGVYLWNDGSTSPAITVSQPGQYWLQVKNNDGCTTADSIFILAKDCRKGFFMPGAFTPNKDGKNDVLKPLLFGSVKQYRFSIYNRWGYLIFESNDPAKGWNGELKEMIQDGNVFVWICHFQFEGKPMEIERGTVVLLR